MPPESNALLRDIPPRQEVIPQEGACERDPRSWGVTPSEERKALDLNVLGCGRKVSSGMAAATARGWQRVVRPPTRIARTCCTRKTQSGSAAVRTRDGDQVARPFLVNSLPLPINHHHVLQEGDAGRRPDAGQAIQVYSYGLIG